MSERSSLKTPAERVQHLESLLAGARADTRADRRTRMNRPRNLMFGVALHAAARQDAGQSLTELEQRLLERVGKVIPLEELPALGRTYAAARARGSISIFPEPIASLSLDQGFSDADLRAALPTLGQELMAQPNFNRVDVSKPGANDSHDTEAFSAALAEYGCGMTLVTGGPRGVSARSAPMDVKVRMHSFKCVKSSGDGMFNSKDEVYWGVSAGSDTQGERSHKTREYGSIKDGSWPTFDSDTYLFSGTVNNDLTCNVQCWEADDSNGGFYNDLRSTLADIAEHCIDTAVELAETGDDELAKAAAIHALTAVVLGLVNEVLRLVTNDDDLVCERTLSFDRAALLHYSNKPNGEDWWTFNGGGGGHHKLYLRFDAVVPPVAPGIYCSALNGTSWSDAVKLPSGTTGKRSALAAHDGKLHCLVRGEGNEDLYHATFDGTAWTTFTRLGDVASSEAPALAAFNGKLYLVYNATSTESGMYWRVFDGNSWSSPEKMPMTVYGAAKGPSLGVYKDRLYCATLSSRDSAVYFSAYFGSSWSAWSPLGTAQSEVPPALAEFNGTLYCVWSASKGSHLHWSSLSPTHWSSWSAPNDFPSGTTTEPPTLAAHDGKLHCLVRGEGNERLYHATFHGTSWTSFTPLTLASPTPPALAVFNDTLYCVYCQ